MGATRDAVRAYEGPPLFSYGFRPFFLASALWAAVAVPVWIGAYLLGDGTIGGVDGRSWHVHEMLFGFGGGVIAGFLLTAVPNWTGRMPVSGAGLVGLFSLWVLGRAAGFLPASMSLLAAIADSAFLFVFAGVVWREILAARNRRNLPICLMVSVLALANAATHLGLVWTEAGPVAERAAVAVIVGLIALIGGRIIPSFTQNWTQARGLTQRPAPFGKYDQLTLAATAPGLLLWVIEPYSLATGVVLAAAGVLHLLRMVRWRGWLSAPEPMVWSLHAGYAGVPLGLLLLGLSALMPDVCPRSAGVHALTAWAIGLMTLAVMTRASRGHTGRPREADMATTAVYVFALLAALTRVVAPFLPDAMMALLGLSAALWCLAFVGFVLAYGPMLLRRSL